MAPPPGGKGPIAQLQVWCLPLPDFRAQRPPQPSTPYLTTTAAKSRQNACTCYTQHKKRVPFSGTVGLFKLQTQQKEKPQPNAGLNSLKRNEQAWLRASVPRGLLRSGGQASAWAGLVPRGARHRPTPLYITLVTLRCKLKSRPGLGCSRASGSSII